MNENKGGHWSYSEFELRNDPLQLAVLLSNKGTGSNLQGILEVAQSSKLNADVRTVVSDKIDALGLERARKYNIPDPDCIPFYAPEGTPGIPWNQGQGLVESLQDVQQFGWEQYRQEYH